MYLLNPGKKNPSFFKTDIFLRFECKRTNVEQFDQKYMHRTYDLEPMSF